MNVLPAAPHQHARKNSRGVIALFALAACMLAVAPSLTQAQSAVTVPVKNPTTALIFGIFIPGSGHIYAGEPIRGLAIMAATVGVASWAVSASHTSNYDYTCSHGCIDPSKDPNYTTLAVGLTIAGAIWVVSALDAPRAAMRENARNKLRQMATTGIPLVGPWSVAPTANRVHGKLSTGLRLSMVF